MQESVLYVESTMIRTCVVYDTQSGDLVHVHEFFALPGVTPPTDDELENEACDLACRIAAKERQQIATLIVRREDLKVGVEYAVDLKTKAIVVKGRRDASKARP